MAITLAKHRRYGEEKAASERIAKQYREQQKKAKGRGFFSKLLGGVGGKLLGGAITGFLGLTGIGAPLGAALGNMLAKKGAYEMTRGMGADPSKIKGGGEYGYGKEEAKTLREALEEQQSSLDPYRGSGTFGKELLGSYVQAGMAGDLKGSLKKFGKEGFLAEKGKGLLGGGGLKGALEGGGEGLKGAWGDVTTWGGEEEVEAPTKPDILMDEGYSEGYDVGEEYLDESSLLPYQQGGIVPRKAPTIANYFGMQGKSLGGSNKHSLAEMLGRK